MTHPSSSDQEPTKHLGLSVIAKNLAEKRRLAIEVHESEIIQNPQGIRVSPEDADLLFNHRWATDRKGYAMRHARNPRRAIRLHREVISRKYGRHLEPDEICDHIDGNKRNNTRSNLRITDVTGNAQNRNRKSQGVYWNKRTCKWRAAVKHKQKTINLGEFENRQRAVEVSRIKRIELGFLSRTHYDEEDKMRSATHK